MCKLIIAKVILKKIHSNCHKNGHEDILNIDMEESCSAGPEN